MLEKIKNKLYKALLCMLTPKVSLQRYFDRKLKEGEALISQEALKKANEATTAATNAVEAKQPEASKPKVKEGPPVKLERSSVSLKQISVTDPRAGAKIANAISMAILDEGIAGNVNASIYLDVISKHSVFNKPAGMVRITREIRLADQKPDGSRLATASIAVDMYMLTNPEKNEYTHMTRFANVGAELSLEAPVTQSFAMFNIASEYECFQALHGIYGADFPFERYNKDVNDNAVDLYTRSNGNEKRYQIKEVVELALDHSNRATHNHIKITATIEGLTEKPVEIGYGEVKYAKI